MAREGHDGQPIEDAVYERERAAGATHEQAQAIARQASLESLATSLRGIFQSDGSIAGMPAPRPARSGYWAGYTACYDKAVALLRRLAMEHGIDPGVAGTAPEPPP